MAVVATRTPYQFSPVAIGTVTGVPTPEAIRLLKQHVIAAALHVATIKTQMAMSQQALAAIDPAEVNKVVVAGYPPPAV
jgi:hypothetical protein